MGEQIIDTIKRHMQTQLDISQNEGSTALAKSNALQQLMAYMRIHEDIAAIIKQYD